MVLPEIVGATTAWLWASFGNDIKDFAKDAAIGIWTASQWKRAATRYRENLYRQYNRIQIFGQPEPVPLEGIFTHTNILDRPLAFDRYDIEKLREAVREDPSQFHKVEKQLTQSEVKRVDGLELVSQANSDRLFILGKPGAGKTTFLKHLALQAVLEKIDAIPIFVSLKEWADSEHSDKLLTFLASRFNICDFPDAEPFVEFILDKGKALVLFDGLDEVNHETRESMRLIPTLTDFCNKYRNSQCLVTCRTAATDYTFEGFRYVEVADFDEDQMQAFAHKWFRDDTDLCDSFWEEFQKDEHRGLRELGHTPLLLTLLCLGYQETLSFPQRRVEIYEEALDALLKKWDSSRKIARDVAYEKLSLGRKRQMFARIAAETFDQGDYFFRQADLEKRIVDCLQHLPSANQEEDIDGTAVLKAIEAQHGIFVERADRIYAFAHLTFQEYFAAKYVVDNAREGTIPRLLSHCTDDRWREVILLTASLLDKADGFFDEFRQHIDSLITSDENLMAFIRWATDKTTSVQPAYKPAAVRGFYCHLALDLDRDLFLASDLDRARALALDLCSALDRNLASDLCSALDRNLVSDLDLDLDLTCALDCASDPTLTHARALDRASNLNLRLARALGHGFKLEVKLVSALDRNPGLARYLASAIDRVSDPNLHQALAALQVPEQNAPAEAQRAYADELQSIMKTHRNIGHKWEFTPEQIKRLTVYFEANQLLVKCLNLAYVSDRATIENSLLLPPET